MQMHTVSLASRRKEEEVKQRPPAQQPPTRSVSACALRRARAGGWAGGRGWARDRGGPPTPQPEQGHRASGHPPMVPRHQTSVCRGPSPPQLLSCDPGQVRKVSRAGAAPRLPDLSAARERAGAGTGRRRPAPGDSGRHGDTFVSSLGAPRLGGWGWPWALRGEGCRRAGAQQLGKSGHWGGGGSGSRGNTPPPTHTPMERRARGWNP